MHESRPRVSTVVPIYNGALFLAEAIESVLVQTFTSWELILVDDGSVDESPRIAAAYAFKHPGKIRLLHHPERKHRGTAATRNLGIDHARGEYVANLDQDDIWTNSKLEEQVAILDGHPGVAMTFAPMLLWYCRPDSAGAKEERIQKFTFKTESLFEPPSYVPLLLSGQNDPHGYLIRKEAISDVGGYVEGLGICEDWALFTKIAMSYSIYVSGCPSYYYRHHSGQTCSVHRRIGNFYNGFIPFFDWLRVYLADRNCADKQVLEAFNRAVRKNRVNRWREAAIHAVRCLLYRSSFKH